MIADNRIEEYFFQFQNHSEDRTLHKEADKSNKSPHLIPGNLVHGGDKIPGEFLK